MEPTSIVYLSAEVVVGFMTVVGNCFVLAVLIRTRQLHTVTNVFVGNLAVADIVVGVLVAPCAALSYLGLPRNFYGCVFINCLILMFTNVSILMLLSVAIERFIAIKEPFLYQRILTVRRAFYVNFFVWILGSALGLVPMYGWHRGYRYLDHCSFTDIINYEYLVYFQFFGLVLLPLFIMLCVYIYILLIVRRHMRQTNALHNQFRQSRDPKDTTFNKDVKAAKMFALVILLFGIFWFPVNLFNCVSLFCGLDCPFPIQGLLAAIVMSHANSSINPFLYAANNSRIKRGLKELLRIKLKPDERNTSEYDNKRTNGFSYAKDNSVAPISSVADSAHCIEDAVEAFTISQTFLAKGKIAVLPADQRQQNGNGILPKNSKQSDSETDIHQNLNVHNKSLDLASDVSYSTPLANAEILPVSQHPAPENYHFEDKPQLETTMNKSSVILPNTPDSFTPLRRKFENNYTNYNNKSTTANTNIDSDVVRHENMFPEDTANNKVFSTHNYSAAERTKSDIIHNNHDNSLCWTTSVNPSAVNASVHDIDKSSVFDKQKTSLIEMGEELIVNKLNGYVSSKRTLYSSQDNNRQSSLDKRDDTELIEEVTTNTHINNNIEAIHQGLKNEASFRSSILLDECGALRDSDTEHTQF